MQFEHCYGLLIGVGEHATVPRLSLPVTVKDVTALHKTLLEPDLCAYPKDHIKRLLNEEATNSAIIAGLNGLKAHAAADPQSTVLIYYSGHGWVSPDGDYCLLTQDTTPGAVADTALRAATLNNVLRGIQAERVLIILDCCHAEGMAEAKDFEDLEEDLAKGIGQGAQATLSLVQTLSQGTGRAVFCSSRGNEKSYFYRDETLSVFTYHFIEALQGAGHAPGETTVTIASLMKYVAAAVPATVERLYGKSQHPFFKFEGTDFPVALIWGGKGLPPGGWESVRPRAEEYLAKFTQPVTLTGSGAIARGDRAKAIGAGGVLVEGHSTGIINTGHMKINVSATPSGTKPSAGDICTELVYRLRKLVRQLTVHESSMTNFDALQMDHLLTGWYAEGDHQFGGQSTEMLLRDLAKHSSGRRFLDDAAEDLAELGTLLESRRGERTADAPQELDFRALVAIRERLQNMLNQLDG